MQFYGKAEQAATQIVRLFESPETLPKALAPIFVRRTDDIPCRSWSWGNQILTALAGTSDARGYRQWQHANRHVNKGARSFTILAPCVVKRTETDDTGKQVERRIIVGFRGIPV